MKRKKEVNNEEHDINLPPDADRDRDRDSKHAPALFALKGTEEGFVVPALYFEELSELVLAKTAIPEEGGLVVPENYFEESAELIVVKTIFPTEDGFIVPENYFEDFSSMIEAKTVIPSEDGLVVPENYFEEFGANLESHIVLDNVKQDDGLVVPFNYFENLTNRVLAETSLDKDEVNNDEVPIGYFDALHDTIVDRLRNEGTIDEKEERGRVIVLSQWKKYVTITAVAASVALLIALTWTFIGNENNGDGSLIVASNNKGLVPENYVKETPEVIIDTVSSINVVVPEGIAHQLPNNPNDFKPTPENEVIMNDDEIIAQSDVMDENMVMDFMFESEFIQPTEEVLDADMMEYLMNDNTSLDAFDPGNKK